MTSAQLQTLKAAIATNAATIPAGQPWTNGFAGVAVKDIPNSNDGNQTIAGWYSQTAASDFWVWITSLSRATIYTTVTDANSVWNWTTYQQQSVVQQNSWVQIFMGDACNFSLLNNRAGVSAIFGNTGAGGTQRDHCFAVGRRTARNIEKLFAAAVVSVGGITVNNTNGNVLTDPLGGTTNPAVMGFEGPLSPSDVENARNS